MLGGGALTGYFLFRGQSAIVRQRMQPAQADEIARADAQVRALLPPRTVQLPVAAPASAACATGAAQGSRRAAERRLERSRALPMKRNLAILSLYRARRRGPLRRIIAFRAAGTCSHLARHHATSQATWWTSYERARARARQSCAGVERRVARRSVGAPPSYPCMERCVPHPAVVHAPYRAASPARAPPRAPSRLQPRSRSPSRPGCACYGRVVTQQTLPWLSPPR